MPKKNEHSSYYDAGGISVVDIWKAKMTQEEFIGLCKGNAIKYVLRAGKKSKKHTVEDLKKAIDYIQNWIEALEDEKHESV